MQEQDIQKRVWQHLARAISRYEMQEKCNQNDWFVIAAVGSMNYNLFDESSDVDTKLLVFPSVANIIFKEKQFSKTMNIDEEICEVKDIRKYFRIMEKANINFLEILATDYYIVNPMYEDFWNKLRAETENICRNQEQQLLTSSLGMMRQKYKQMTKDTPAIHEKIAAHSYDSKSLMHLTRLFSFIDKYANGAPFTDAIWCNGQERETLLGIKNYNFTSVDAAQSFAQGLISVAEEIVRTRLNSVKSKDCQLSADKSVLSAVLYDTMCKYFENKFPTKEEHQ